MLYFLVPPQPESEFKVYGLQLDKTAKVTVQVKANPKPRIAWEVNGEQISEGNYKDRYEALTPIRDVRLLSPDDNILKNNQ